MPAPAFSPVRKRVLSGQWTWVFWFSFHKLCLVSMCRAQCQMNGTLGCEIRESPCLSRAADVGDNTVQRTRVGSLSQCSDPNFVPVPALADSAAPLPNGKLVTRMKHISFWLDLLSRVSADGSSDGSGVTWEWRGGKMCGSSSQGNPGLCC